MASVTVCVCVSQCVCVHTCVHPCCKRKNGLICPQSTPNLVHIYSMAVAWHSLTQMSRSHGYKNHHGRMAASEVCCCCRRGTARHTTAWVSSSVRKMLAHMNTLSSVLALDCCALCVLLKTCFYCNRDFM